MATSAPTPTASLAPEALLARGLEYRAAGAYDLAAEDFYAAAELASDGATARAARFYLGESFALRGRWTSTVDALTAFVAAEPADEFNARALFLIARGHEEAGSHAAAIAAYERFRALATPAEPYARLRQAAQERALGNWEAAAANYEAVARGAIPRGIRAGAYEQAIASRRELGQSEAALSLAVELLNLATQPEYRARLLREYAELPRLQGDAPTARAWLTEAIQTAPASPDALAALALLQGDAEMVVPAELAARVYEAHGRWPEAIAALDSALAAAAEAERADLLRRRALALRATGDFSAALAGFDAALAAAGESDVARQAQLDRVQTVGQSGETETAIQGYRAFAETWSDDSRAPEALRRAALLLERLEDREGAARQRIELGRRYPASAAAQEAMFGGGLHFFAEGQHAEARAAWEALASTSEGAVAARARYWAARAAQAEGDSAQATALLEQVIATAPDSYFAARARALLQRQETGAIAPDAPIGADEWRAAEEWLAGWAGAAPSDPPDLLAVPAIGRALELETLGLRVEAIGEWSAALAERENDPYALYALARLAHERGVPAIALRAASRIARLAPGNGAASAPNALRRLIYPAPFITLVRARADEYGVDPALLLALLRQESAFDPAATSWVGARGLAQVMPATGQGIAQALGIADFRETDLYRPDLSIRFGSYYLSRQIAAMDQVLEGALAAYNGGPGNAQRWSGGAPISDPDLYVERIDFEETRNYVKLVLGQYAVYQRMYDWRQATP